MRLRDGVMSGEQEGRMVAGGQKEKCVTNVETAPENVTVGVNGREARLSLMRITNPHHTPLLNFQGSTLVCILYACVFVRVCAV